MKFLNIILTFLIFWSGITLTQFSNLCSLKTCCCVQEQEDQSCYKTESKPCALFYIVILNPHNYKNSKTDLENK